ncbi:MAG: sulfatase [Thermodesulfobacteriota bacterium]
MMRRTVVAALGLVAVAVVVALVTPRLWPAHGGARRPNVLLLSIDTLRADHLGCYGGTRVTTPNVDRIAAEGALFENAACPMPMTRPSLATVHTSLHAREHGVVNNALALPDDARTLAETLAEAGYATAAFTPVRLLDGHSGLAQGFATYVAPEAHHLPADRVAPQALDWLAARDPERPFFLWLHLFDPHLPYAPPARYAPGPGPSKVSWRSLLSSAEEHGGDVPASVLARALELYAGEVAYVDHWVGEVRSRLEALGVLDETILVFTADHGECFDHGVYFEHADCLYDGAARVPLLVRAPARVAPGTRVTAQVEHLDLAPTILALAGVAAPSSFRGRAVLPSPPASRGELAPEAFALIEHPLYQEDSATRRARKQRRILSVAGTPTRPPAVERRGAALRGERWKMIREPEQRELYDLRADPGETTNLAAQDAARVAELEKVLAEKQARAPLRVLEPGAVDPRLRETLRALGYVQ